MHKLRLHGPALLSGLLSLALTRGASAQPAAPHVAPAPSATAPTAAPVPPDKPTAAPPATADASELQRLRAEVDATKKEVADLKAAQAEAAAAAPDEPVAEQEKLKIYGFAD